MAEEEAPKKGVIAKMIGAGFVFVGMLNVLLAWRGAFDVHYLQIAIIAAGAFIYALGLIRSGES